MTKEDMETYNKSVLEYADVRRCFDFAKHEARQEGIYEIAQKCVQEGMSFDLIVKLTGLSAEEIRDIDALKAFG
ncbi:hypothetical protein AGMMS4957_20870 [Bacteroidia bacterium]|nr:hypothetical protein AGMMS4957_20870 [Bacteroidia bacterium]